MRPCLLRPCTARTAAATTSIKPHVERFNNVLRQRLARLVRRTLSFPKCDVMHEACLLLFLHEHNQPTWHRPKKIRIHV